MSELHRAAGTGATTGSLAWYVGALIEHLGEGEPAAGQRMREIVGHRRALVALNDEAVIVWFDGTGRLHVEDSPPPGNEQETADGEGRTTHTLVLALLDGDREATDAILDGDIEIRGSSETVAAMLAAIDILIDGATRVSALRELAQAYRRQHGPRHHRTTRSWQRQHTWPPVLVDPAEEEMLRSLGLDSGASSFTMGGEATT
jgi:hypothetical protein